ncbi:MAG: hypothetical protein ACFFE5_08685, partial [Candidatus Thorarchaeota archaeon]
MTEDLSDNSKGSNNEIKVLKARIDELKAELNEKENEISEKLEIIENLEDYIMKIESLIPEEDDDNKSKKQKLAESKMALDIEEKEREIRDLKNRMGFLRKEKVRLQQELEKLNRKNKSTSIVINTEDLRVNQPLEVLVKELQDKVNKQKSIIHNLKRESIDINEFNDRLKEQEKVIEKKLAFSMQKQIDNQKETIKTQKETIEDLKKENEKIKK